MRGQNNATGLRLYYDAASRSSGFEIELAPALPADVFLHSSGALDFWDDAAPVGMSALSKDSAGVNFTAGNPWTEVGTWTLGVPEP